MDSNSDSGNNENSGNGSSSSSNDSMDNNLSDDISHNSANGDRKYNQGGNQNQNSSEVDFSDKDYEDMESFLDNKFPNREKSFFIKSIDYIENFKMTTFKKDVEDKKEDKKQKKENEEKLKEAGTTINDINKQRDSFLKNVMGRGLLFGLAGTLVISAFMLARQNNESFDRKVIETTQMINDAASFGNIGDKDYFMEQNVLNDKIDIVQKESRESIKLLQENMTKQTALIKEHINVVVGKSENKRLQSDSSNLNTISKIIDKKISELDNKQTLQLEKLSQKIDSNSKKIKEGVYVRNSGNNGNHREKRPHLDFTNGQVILLSGNKATTIQGDDVNSSSDSSNGSSGSNGADYSSNDEKTANSEQNNRRYYKRRKIRIIEEEYEMIDEEIELISSSEDTLSISTLYEDEDAKGKGKFKSFEVDLTTALVRATLLTGVRAATLDVGVSNPSPVLLSLEGSVHLSNDYVTDLRGCFLRATAIGNINTEKAEIFGTNLSCVIVAEDGKKYKIDHTFANNEVWIKGEDGSDGVAGKLVDSSGKVLAKSAAIGFAQGLSSYFASQATPTGILGTTDSGEQTTIQASVQNGTASAMTKSFELIVAQYEKILSGYYPYIDVKGGRKNLTVFFGGGVKMKVEEFEDPSLETMIHNNMERGYESDTTTTIGAE